MKKKVIICMIVFCLFITESVTMEVKVQAKTDSETERLITVEGNIRAVILPDVSSRTNGRVMNLEGQVVNIMFESSNNKVNNKVSTITDEKGNYIAKILVKGEGELTVEVESNEYAHWIYITMLNEGNLPTG